MWSRTLYPVYYSVHNITYLMSLPQFSKYFMKLSALPPQTHAQHEWLTAENASFIMLHADSTLAASLSQIKDPHGANSYKLHLATTQALWWIFQYCGKPWKNKSFKWCLPPMPGRLCVFAGSLTFEVMIFQRLAHNLGWVRVTEGQPMDGAEQYRSVAPRFHRP